MEQEEGIKRAGEDRDGEEERREEMETRNKRPVPKVHHESGVLETLHL